ncbi:MAG: hypothetical protein KC636_37095, partial [Myxococcales bacterium]|nr:hypothetical protein [Myxococcales bacterium]
AAPPAAPPSSAAAPADGEIPPEDLSMDDIFGDQSDGAAPPAKAGAPSSSQGEVAAGDLSMDDIFGDQGGDTKGAAPPAVKDSAPAPQKKSRFRDQIDFRVRLLSSVYYAVARADPRRFDRNENRVEAYVTYKPNEHIELVGGLEGVFMGVAQAQELNDLATRQMLTPFHFESDAAYLGIYDLLPGLDLKLGRQIVVWGTADKFNPTNNLNPDDLEDRPLFTEPIANQMAVLEYRHPKLGDKLFLQGVYIPLFYPALLPPSAAAALKSPFAPVPYATLEDRDKLRYLQDVWLRDNDRFVPAVYGNLDVPSTVGANAQFAFKIGSSLGPVDFSASYYYGRHDIPFPVEVVSSQLAPFDEEPVDGHWVQSDVRLIYPRMQVVGLDFAATLPFLDDLGLWGEAGLFIPEPNDLRIELPIPVDVTPSPVDELANPVNEVTGPAIRSTPFVKATVGLDYTIGKHVYVQAQYLRGFIDEFGVDHINNYLVGGTDIVFFGRHLIFRLFGVVDFPTNNDPGEGASGVIAPAILGTLPWGSVTLEVGSFAFVYRSFDLGDGDTRLPHNKFGQEATGTSIVYFKAIGAF